MSAPRWTSPEQLRKELDAQRDVDELSHGRIVAESRHPSLHGQRVAVHFDGERFVMVGHSPEGGPREFVRAIPSAAEAATVCRCLAVTPYGATELRRLGHDVSGAGEVERMAVPAKWTAGGGEP
jgi:hypothetical protein